MIDNLVCRQAKVLSQVGSLHEATYDLSIWQGNSCGNAVRTFHMSYSSQQQYACQFVAIIPSIAACLINLNKRSGWQWHMFPRSETNRCMVITRWTLLICKMSSALCSDTENYSVVEGLFWQLQVRRTHCPYLSYHCSSHQRFWALHWAQWTTRTDSGGQALTLAAMLIWPSSYIASKALPHTMLSWHHSGSMCLSWPPFSRESYQRQCSSYSILFMGIISLKGLKGCQCCGGCLCV